MHRWDWWPVALVGPVAGGPVGPVTGGPVAPVADEPVATVALVY